MRSERRWEVVRGANRQLDVPRAAHAVLAAEQSWWIGGESWSERREETVSRREQMYEAERRAMQRGQREKYGRSASSGAGEQSSSCGSHTGEAVTEMLVEWLRGRADAGGVCAAASDRGWCIMRAKQAGDAVALERQVGCRGGRRRSRHAGVWSEAHDGEDCSV